MPLLLIVCLTTSCGWHLRSKMVVPPQMKKIIFDFENSHGPLSRAICNHLRSYHIELITNRSIHQDIPLFRVLNSSLSIGAASISHNGRTVEHHMILSVSAAVLIPNKNFYPISTKIHRSFFVSAQTALARDVEQKILINEMYDRAAEELVSNFLSVSIK